MGLPQAGAPPPYLAQGDLLGGPKHSGLSERAQEQPIPVLQTPLTQPGACPRGDPD